MTPDEAVRRAKAALAEMGYGDAEVWHEGKYSGYNGDPVVQYVPSQVPDAVAWQVSSLVFDPRVCWTCFLARKGAQCADGNCTAGPDDPKRPPRELLVAK